MAVPGSSKRRLTPGHPDERAVVQLWRQSQRTEGTIRQYLRWVWRFGAYCRASGLSETEELTRDGVDRFAEQYCGPRMRQTAPARVRRPARVALGAWSWGLRSLGRRVPDWIVEPSPEPLPPLIEQYVRYRRRNRDVSEGTLLRDIPTANEFLKIVEFRSGARDQPCVDDVDRFIGQIGQRMSRRTVKDVSSSLRAFLRFLYAMGETDRDLSEFVVSPHVRRVDRPPRALPWKDVREILTVAKRAGRAAWRDYAVLLLMATYGLGTGEIVSLQIEDVDWNNMLLRVRRPKTGAFIELPLLPEVARSIARYLQSQRPCYVVERSLFLALQLPHRPLTTSAIRHFLRKYAHEAGVRADMLGGHALRHSFATRQVEQGANPKVVGDILGHRRPESTSVYVRVALR